MPTYVIGGYAAGSILTSGGGAPTNGSSFMLDPAFVAATSALTFTVTDNDTNFSGSSLAQLDGDQTVVVTDSGGAVIASGAVRLGRASTFTQPGGGSVTLYEVWVGGTLTGYVSTAELVPGVSVTVTAQSDTGATGPLYSALDTPDYNPAANTVFTGGAGDDSILAGAGNDTVFANAGNDSIDGGAGNDSVVAGAGDDLIFGGDGADTLFTGTGWDVVFGGDGNDFIDDAGGVDSSVDPTLAFGDAGNDTIYGTAGADSLYGGADNDLIGGESGDDFLSGDDGNDTLQGENGNDSLFGGDGRDSLLAGAGDDAVFGGNDIDTIFGGTGNDTLAGGAGGDSLSGDDGNDVFLVGQGDGTDTIFGGTGTDRIDYSGTVGVGVSVTFSSTAAGSATVGGVAAGSFSSIEEITGSNQNDLINATSGATTGLRLDGGGGDDTITGGTGADTIIGGTGNDSLTGNGGSDTFVITAGDGSDSIFGGSGTDSIDASGVTDGLLLSTGTTGNGTLTGPGLSVTYTSVGVVGLGAGNDTLLGGSGSDSVSGGAGDDELFGGAGTDTLDGGAGNDTLRGGSGSDTLFGGDGDDTFLLASGEGTDTITGGAGNDAIDASLINSGLNLSMSGAGAGTISGVAGTFGFSDIEVTRLGSGNDTASGSASADTIDGGSGNDRILGNAGNDLLIGGAGNDTLEGGLGDDTLRGGAGRDVLWGGTGLDWVDYSDSDAAVTINLLAFTVSGGYAEGDQLQGTDAVIGSSFNDTIIGFDDEALTGSDIYYNILWGGAGDDFIDGRAGGDEIDGGTGNDTLFGGAGNDTVTGGEGDDSVFGGDGADILGGGSGNDTVDGGSGNDTLDGGDGDDTLVGGSGNDTITGGAGSDIFRITTGGGSDVITDLVIGTDRIDVSSLVDQNGQPVDWADVIVADDGNGNALLTFPGGEQILIQGVSPEDVTGKQALFQLGVPCFAAGSLVLTGTGERPIEAIRTGDLVMTRDRGLQPVIWRGHRHLGPADLDLRPDLRPVVIRAGAFGDHREVQVSPQHAILVDTPQGERLARARHLAQMGDKRFRVAQGKRQVTYHHLLLPQHALLRVNGLWSESLYPGPMALSALGVTACLDLARSVPFLAPVLAGRADVGAVYGPTARPLAARRGLALANPAALADA